MGRPAKVRPPPHAWQASGGGLSLLRADDLTQLPQTKRLPCSEDADLPTIAAALNEAFDWYALWAVGQHKRAAHSEVRDWFNQVAGQATDLLHALGHDKPALADQGFQDVLTHLIVTKPHPSESAPNQERHARYRMESLARLAMPEAYAQAQQKNADNPGWQVANDCIGKRLKATLGMLQLLAARGAAHHASLVTKGGKDPEEPRKHLFVALAGQYGHLFGRPPGAPSTTPTKAEKGEGELRQSLPKGPALDWFKALLSLVEARAAEALSSDLPGGVLSNPDHIAMLQELMSLTATARKGKAADGLAHWIRDAADIYARKAEPAKELFSVKTVSGRRPGRG